MFSKPNFETAYQEIPIATEDIPKTAVITCFELFEYVVGTYGLRNARQIFQRYIFQPLGELDFAFAYIGDILIASFYFEEHDRHIRLVFQRRKQFGLRINAYKCQFELSEIQFAGHAINRDGFKSLRKR